MVLKLSWSLLRGRETFAGKSEEERGGGKGLEIGPTLVLYLFISPFSCDPNGLAEK